MNVKSKSRWRRLRLELLETRSLLSAAPWGTLDIDAPLDRGRRFESDTTLSVHHRLFQGMDDRGDSSQSDRSRPNRRDGQTPRGLAATDKPERRGNGTDTRGNGTDARGHGLPSRLAPSPLAGGNGVGFDSKLDRPRDVPQSLGMTPTTSQRDPILRPDVLRQAAQPLERSTVFVFRFVPTTLVFTEFVDAPSSSARIDVVEVTASKPRDVAIVNASQSRQSNAVPTDAMLPTDALQASASFTVDQERADVRLADANPRQFATGPFNFDSFSLGSDTRASWRTLSSQGHAGFERAWLQLFSDSAKEQEVAELDELLETLAQENASGGEVAQPSSADDGPKFGLDSSVHPAERAAIVDLMSDRGEFDGMIAMDLPDDLLVRENEWLGRESGSDAWTVRVGIYRPHVMEAARGAAAVASRPINAPRSNAISETELQGDEAIVARLRPVIAATSAAFGAIFIGLRKQRRKLRDQQLNSQKLS